MAPVTVNDVIAVTAFIGSIFGSGGGAEASNANLLAALLRAGSGARPVAREAPDSASPDKRRSGPSR